MRRFSYTLAYVGLLLAYVAVTAVMLVLGVRGWVQIVAFAGFVGCWHVISAERIREVGRPWLHLAPYFSVAGLPFSMIFVGQAQGQSAPLPQDVHPIPAWHDLATAAALMAMLVWPAATIALSILPTRRR